MPTPRYLTGILADRLGQAGASGTTDPDARIFGITLEEIERIEGELYGFRGYLVHARAFLSAEVGDRVYVQWQGGQPISILSVTTRQGSADDVPEATTVKVEELLLVKIGGVWDVWFRDTSVFVPLKVSASISHDGSLGPEFETAPALIRWGQGANTFVVQTTYRADQIAPGPITVPIVAPRFYVFSLKDRKAELVATMSPPVSDSGLPQLSGGQPRYIPNACYDVLLTEQGGVPRVFFLTSPSSGGDQTGIPVWVMTGAGEIASILPGLNGPYGPNTQIAVADPGPTGPPFDVTSSTTVFAQLMFVGWDPNEPINQRVFAEVQHFATVITFNGVSAFDISGSNIRRYVLATGDGSAASLVPDQAASWAYSTPDVGGSPKDPPFQAALMGVTDDIIVLGGGFGGAKTCGQYLIVTDLVGVPLSLPNPNIPGVTGGVRTDVKFGMLPVKGPDILLTSALPAVPFPFVLPNLGYYRWLRSDVLFVVPLGIDPVPTELTTPPFPALDVMAPARAQRNESIAFPSVVFYPPGGLKQNTKVLTGKLVKWAPALPPPDGSNATDEVSLSRDLALTAYRLRPVSG